MRALFGGDIMLRATTTGATRLNDEALSMTLWDAETGGTQVTDLLSHPDKTAITEVAVTGATTPPFYGPDGVVALWAEFAGDTAGRELVRGTYEDAADNTQLAPVAKTGAYTDLTGQPTIPTTAADVSAEPAGLSAETQAALNDTYLEPGEANTLWLSAATANPHVGAPAPASVGTGTPAYLLDATTPEQVSFGFIVPSWMTAINVRFVWCNYGTGTGDVRWRTVYDQNAGAGSSFLGSPTAPTGLVATAAGQYVRIDTQMLAGIAVTGRMWSLRVWREADNATDTLPNDAALVGIIVEDAS